MKIYTLPPTNKWEEIIKRPSISFEEIFKKVRPILKAVKDKGDEAISHYTHLLDGLQLKHISPTKKQWDSCKTDTPITLQKAIYVATKNIRTFHESYSLRHSKKIHTMEGVSCWYKTTPIDKVGLYIPSGSAPLFSTVLMLGIPALLAGCKEIVLCSPPTHNGGIHPYILYAAKSIGIHQVFLVGGAQAIAGMGYGTKTIPSVYKIVGPGNQFVTAAKILMQQEGVAIDMPAGPSEVCILADKHASPDYIASDLIAQCEHGKDSQSILVTTHELLIKEVHKSIERLLPSLPRQSIIKEALKNSKAILFKNKNVAMDFINRYAPEHLIIACENPHQLIDHIYHAGSVFLGYYSPESAGDYASGTNHTLPTLGFAKSYSGVSISTFQKNISLQMLSKQGLKNLAPTVITMAEAEGLHAHALSIKIRNLLNH